jgi:hypothetical protein
MAFLKKNIFSTKGLKAVIEWGLWVLVDLNGPLE